MHPRGRAFTTSSMMLVRTQIDERGRISVISVLEHDHVPRFRMRACKTNREFVRLAAGVHEETDTQRLRQRRREFLCIFKNQLTEVPRVRIQPLHLPLPGSNDLRMTMTDVRDVVERIEIPPPFIVIEILHRPAHYM